MSNFSYFVFNVPGSNFLRDYCYIKINNSLKNIDRLNSKTEIIKTKEECFDFINNNSGFTVNTIKGYSGENTIFPPRAGVIAVIASNYTAWKNFLKTDYDYLLLFEDDVLVSKNLVTFLNMYVSELPEDWDIFSLYIPDDIKYLYNPLTHDIPNKNYVCKSYTTHCCAAYVISKKGAQKAIDDIEKNGISAPIDWYVLNVKHLGNEPDIFNVYCLKPNQYMPIKELKEVYYNSSLHYGKTEEFDSNVILF
jgi:GR25 family glycosyltransferase involved in LPS biosynthesis